MDGETFLKDLKSIIKESPADQIEVVLISENSSLTRFTGSTIHQNVAEKNSTLVLRVIMNKKVSVVSTNSLSKSSIRNTLKKAISLLRVQPPNEDSVSLPSPKPIPKINTYYKKIENLTPERKARIIKELFKIGKDEGVEVSGAFSKGVVELAVLNSLGVEAYQKFSDMFIHLIVDDRKNSGYSSFVSRDPDMLDIKSLAREAIEKVAKGEAIQIEPGEYEVILEPYAVAELLSFLGYLGFHALAVQEGRSFFCNQFGKKIVDEKVTIFDDGFDPSGLQIPFDFEGMPKEKVVFFERGVVSGITYDSLTAKKEGKVSTGHALLQPNTEGPIPINLIMEGGVATLEEMIRSVRKGIYITRFHYTNVVEPMKAVITGMTRDGAFLIEGGEIKNPIKNLRFTESILRALSRVSSISKERRVCSEGTVYSRRFITGIVAPAIKVDGFNFSGISSL